MDRVYCGRCERLLSKRSPRGQLESWCDRCRALVPVAVRFRGLGLVRRSELAETIRQQLATTQPQREPPMATRPPNKDDSDRLDRQEYDAPTTTSPQDTSQADVDSRTADGYYEVRGFSPVDPRGQLLGYIVRTPAGWQALDPHGNPLGFHGDDVAAAKRAVEQAATPQPTARPERHGRCPSCLQDVHEYPTGWAHVNVPPAACVGGLVIIPERDVRPGDDIVPARVRGEAGIRY